MPREHGMADTLVRIFLDTVAAHDKAAQFLRKGAKGWESISAERARADVESLALGLSDLGVQAGDRVAILSENRYEWPVADLAILGLGGVSVPIYPSLTAAQCRYILANSEARVAVVSAPEQLDKLRSVAGALPHLRVLVVLDPAGQLRANERAFSAVAGRGAALCAADPLAFHAWAARVVPNDLATIIYTSGTTGEPKGAMLTHGNIASNANACLQVVTLTPADISLSFLPLCHILERMAGLYTMLAAGVTIAYAQSMESVAADVKEVRPTVLTGVPRFFEKVCSRVFETVGAAPPWRQKLFQWGLARGLKRARAHFEGREIRALDTWLADRIVAAQVRAGLGGRLRFCFCGGAPLAPQVMEFFFAMGIPLLEGYGLSETSPVICLNPPGRERPGSVGLAIPAVEVKIGEDGEILTRGPHVMRGYFRDEESTRATLRGGWLHTGDVGRLDPDGYLFITDRLKDLIVLASGKNVAPQPIEASLKESRWVSEAVLLGDRRPFVVCLISPHFANLEAEAQARGWTFSHRADLVQHPEVVALYQAEVDRVNAPLAPFESIRRFAILSRELTLQAGDLTPTFKVKRRVVASGFKEIIKKLYAGHETPAVS
jgi:long-chain acyl-CoA synthetase